MIRLRAHEINRYEESYLTRFVSRLLGRSENTKAQILREFRRELRWYAFFERQRLRINQILDKLLPKEATSAVAETLSDEHEGHQEEVVEQSADIIEEAAEASPPATPDAEQDGVNVRSQENSLRAAEEGISMSQGDSLPERLEPFAGSTNCACPQNTQESAQPTKFLWFTPLQPREPFTFRKQVLHIVQRDKQDVDYILDLVLLCCPIGFALRYTLGNSIITFSFNLLSTLALNCMCDLAMTEIGLRIGGPVANLLSILTRYYTLDSTEQSGKAKAKFLAAT